MKRDILTRLMDQGHITIYIADVILNAREEYLDIINGLNIDGNISTAEALILIDKNPELIFPPHRIDQVPMQAPSPDFQPDWTWDQRRINTWYITSTSDNTFQA